MMLTMKPFKTALVAAAALASAIAFVPTSASAFGGGHSGGFGGRGGHGPVVFNGGHHHDGGHGRYRWGGRMGYYGWGGGYRFRPIYVVGGPSCSPGFFLNYWGHCRPIRPF